MSNTNGHPEVINKPQWHDGLRELYRDLIDNTSTLVPCLEWDFHLPWIDAIQQLKKQRDAIILAHSYQSPEVFYGVADITGDSFQLAQAAAQCTQNTIVLAGVHFMAESAKILAPDKTVLIPDLQAGCSLAESITAEDVRKLRAQYPGVPVVVYVNTSAAVKAEADACCTSANALQVVEAMNAPRVLFLPDQYLGKYVATQTNVELIFWQGSCEVHERFTVSDARQARQKYNAHLLVHPECTPEVIAEADFVGSTSAMVRWIDKYRPAKVALITECSMGDNLRAKFPKIDFVRPCQLCPHMKRIDLPKIFQCLNTMSPAIELSEDIIFRAKKGLQKMLAIGRGENLNGVN